MSMVALYRVRCDEQDCGQVQGVVSENRDEARRRARMAGWDLGPRTTKTRTGTLNHHTDFCPRHKQRDPEEGDNR